MQLLTLDSQPSKPSQSLEENSSDEDDEVEFIGETDAERREALLASEKADDLKSNKLTSSTSWKDFEDDFNFFGVPRKESEGRTSRPGENANSGLDTGLSIPYDDIDEEGDCDVPVASGSTFTTAGSSKKAKERNDTSKGERPARSHFGSTYAVCAGKNLSLRNFVNSEVDLRKKEALGMAPIRSGGRTLGGPPRLTGGTNTLPDIPKLPTDWHCLVCTMRV